MILFETDKKPLTFLLDKIENRELALPDFQRSFVWDPEATRMLVCSIVRSFPAGSLLLMEGGSKIFAPRCFEEAPDLVGALPTHLVLDGQQRLTSLYQAFSGRGTHRFFLNLRELLEGLDLDEATEVYPVRRAKRWMSIEAQAADLMLPLAQIRSFSDWQDEVLEVLSNSEEDIRKLRRRLNEVEKEYVKPVELYQFPVTTLAQTTAAEAVCTIFETLNRTGVKLSVFELITARAFADEVRLRDMWQTACERDQVLLDFGIDPYYLLQAIAMSARGSAKRSTVLSMGVPEIVDQWDQTVRGLASSLTLLRDECGVLVSKWLPYQTMLVTMASAWRGIDQAKGPAIGARRLKMGRWFWCSAFTASYENSPNSKTERDVPELLSWFDGGAEPTAVREFVFDPQRWRETTGRQRALYRSTIALLMRHSPKEFHQAKDMNKPIIDGQAVDDHHIFPRAFLAQIGHRDAVDSVLNHTLIDRTTNIRISGHPPSVYLAQMRTELGPKLDTILESHGLPSGPNGTLLGDRFEEFLEWRVNRLQKELAEVTEAAIDERGLLRTSSERFHASPVTPEAGAAGLPQDVSDFLASRVSDLSKRELCGQFLTEVTAWSGVNAAVTESETSEDGWSRWVIVRRRGSHVGGFAYVNPRSMRILLRMPGQELTGERFAEVRNVKPSNPYRVRVRLESDAALSEALILARQAYDLTY